jgi:hypothetical protein
MKIIAFILLIVFCFSGCKSPIKKEVNVFGIWNSNENEAVYNMEINKEKTFLSFGCSTVEINSKVIVREGLVEEFKGIFQLIRGVVPEIYDPKDDQSEVRLQFYLKDEILIVTILDLKVGNKIGDYKYKKASLKNNPSCR